MGELITAAADGEGEPGLPSSFPGQFGAGVFKRLTSPAQGLRQPGSPGQAATRSACPVRRRQRPGAPLGVTDRGLDIRRPRSPSGGVAAMVVAPGPKGRWQLGPLSPDLSTRREGVVRAETAHQRPRVSTPMLFSRPRPTARSGWRAPELEHCQADILQHRSRTPARRRAGEPSPTSGRKLLAIDKGPDRRRISTANAAGGYDVDASPRGRAARSARRLAVAATAGLKHGRAWQSTQWDGLGRLRRADRRTRAKTPRKPDRGRGPGLYCCASSGVRYVDGAPRVLVAPRPRRRGKEGRGDYNPPEFSPRFSGWACPHAQG